MQAQEQVLEVWGEFACFSRPEMKVERFSYPVITPSAARGIFDAIYCKPKEFRWQLTSIKVLKHPSYIALRRNEVKEKVSVPMMTKMMKGARDPTPIFADVDRAFWGNDTRGRTQRQTMALRDVRYRLHAEARPWPEFASRLKAIEAQFRRRASHGKCFHQPCFGCREFPAYFRLVQERDPLPHRLKDLDLDIGLMLYDVFDLSRPGTSNDVPSISLFHARVRGGVLDVPDYDSPDVLKAERRPR